MNIHKEEASWEMGEDDVYGTISGRWCCDVAAASGKKKVLWVREDVEMHPGGVQLCVSRGLSWV